ncbi:hypothetical protein H0H81_008901 [Sphagnurus paluster]|uniref:G domain-containing protein n=1 Tax=Sphagnurus paluster TaxID=117069 RepID=A0A9P7GQN8_9AGAR|nr:hypothetical protein H0H81_008901 [Sphagnurus paluster]
MSTSTTPVISDEMAADLRKKAGRFRILVIGRANAGKTTILQKVCNTTDQPEIFDKEGNKVWISCLALVNPTGERGIHDINDELIFQSSPGFVFHDSQGFEAGAVDELNLVKVFIESRLKERELDQQLHVIWFCLPVDNARPISRAEEEFFNNCGTGKVPVILIFTKFDGYIIRCFSNLLNQGADIAQAEAEAVKNAENGFAKLEKSLSKYKYPPKKTLHLGDMHKTEATCYDLIKQTSAALDNDVLTQIFILTQQVTARLSTRHALM